jgi:hypothetical protein
VTAVCVTRIGYFSNFSDRCEDVILDNWLLFFFWSDPNFIIRFSTTQGLTRTQLWRYSRTDCTWHSATSLRLTDIPWFGAYSPSYWQAETNNKQAEFKTARHWGLLVCRLSTKSSDVCRQAPWMTRRLPLTPPRQPPLGLCFSTCSKVGQWLRPRTFVTPISVTTILHFLHFLDILTSETDILILYRHIATLWLLVSWINIREIYFSESLQISEVIFLSAASTS